MYRYGSKSRAIITPFDYFRTVIDLAQIDFKIFIIYFENILESTLINRKSIKISCVRVYTLLHVTLCYIGKLFPTAKLIFQCCNPRGEK